MHFYVSMWLIRWLSFLSINNKISCDATAGIHYTACHRSYIHIKLTRSIQLKIHTLYIFLPRPSSNRTDWIICRDLVSHLRQCSCLTANTFRLIISLLYWWYIYYWCIHNVPIHKLKLMQRMSSIVWLIVDNCFQSKRCFRRARVV